MSQHYKTLKPKERTLLIPPNIAIQFSGAERAEQDRKGNVTMYFCNGDVKRARIARDIADFGWFALVDYVNEHERPRGCTTTYSVGR